MRVVVTGARGFVGTWLVRELTSAGHDVVGDPRGGRVDVTDRDAVVSWIGGAAPDAVVHLAAIARPRDVQADPGHAMEIAVAGTANVVAALEQAAGDVRRPVLLITGSSEVYGSPTPDALPLTEDSAVRPSTAYALTKLAQEGIALGHGGRAGLRVIVTRSFNHTGPGQRDDYAVPAFARRIVAAREARNASVPVGNLDVCRDITDVRDVVVAYRRLIEVAAAGGTSGEGLIVNVGSGRCVTMRDLFGRLADLAGAGVEPVVDPDLVRDGEPREIRADVTRLTDLTGWRPAIELATTLRDVLDAVPAMAARRETAT